jgi:nitroreductase
MNDLFLARYRDPELAAPDDLNPVLESILGHRSVRGFLPDALPDGALEAAVAAASSAPTSSNLQTWSVVAVQDPGRRDRLRQLGGGQRFINDAPLLLMWIADLSRVAAIAEQHQAKVEGIEYLELAFVAIIDAALAAQNALVALESMGLGTVYIGGMRNNPEKVAAELKLPPRSFAVFGMSVGVPDPSVATGIKPRLPQKAVLHHETYAVETQLPAVAEYAPRMEAFQTEQGMPDALWPDRVINRVRTAASLNGRDRMREALGALGFALK